MVIISSTKAELFSVLLIVKDLIWWKRFFINIGFELNDEVLVYYDNH